MLLGSYSKLPDWLGDMQNMVPRSELDGLSVLLVDDHAHQREILHRFIDVFSPARVLSAADGQDALACLEREGPVDLVLTDLQMPVMDGVELLRHLAALAKPPSVILMSAVENSILAAAERIAEAYGLDLLGAIKKPVSMDALQGFLMVASHRASSRAAPAMSYASAQQSTFHGEAGFASHEIVPMFQPRLALADDRLDGAEVLARLGCASRRAALEPSSFMPAVEADQTLATLFTEEIAHLASKHLQTWRGLGHRWTLSLNLPAVCLENGNTFEHVTSAVLEQGIPASRVVWDIKETAAAGTSPWMIEQLTRLRLMGFGIALDDYGTGSASLERLASIPFTEVKIDRSFVRGCERQGDSRKMLEATIRLVHALGMTSVAEGVETNGELQVLRDLGCSLAQGYAIARPMPALQFEDWAESR